VMAHGMKPIFGTLSKGLTQVVLERKVLADDFIIIRTTPAWVIRAFFGPQTSAPTTIRGLTLLD
jgi:hypothetical protein